MPESLTSNRRVSYVDTRWRKKRERESEREQEEKESRTEKRKGERKWERERGRKRKGVVVFRSSEREAGEMRHATQ